MAKKLPIQTHPVYTKTLPLSRKVVRYRPFLVKEEKLLLMAKESDSPADAVAAVKNIVNSCLVDAIDVEALPLVDLEFLWIVIRAKSANNIIELNVRDKHGTKIKVEADLEELALDINPDHNPKIEIDDGLGLVMKYPTIDMFMDIAENMADSEFIRLMVRCIDYVYDAEEIYKMQDYTEEEIDEFVNSWTRETFDMLKMFFETMPKLELPIDYVDSKGEQQSVKLSGLLNFFR